MIIHRNNVIVAKDELRFRLEIDCIRFQSHIIQISV